jgi:hypothetical protein
MKSTMKKMIDYYQAGKKCRFLNIEDATQELTYLLGEDVNEISYRRLFFFGYITALSDWINEMKFELIGEQRE